MKASPAVSTELRVFPNRGAQLLAACGSTREIAAAIGATHATVGGWLRGRSAPLPRWREAVLTAFGIEPPDWDRRPAPTAAALVLAEDAAAASLPDGADELDELATQLRTARTAQDVTPAVLSKLGLLEVRVVAAREELRDVRDQAARAPETKEVFGTIIEALQQHPLALFDVERAFAIGLRLPPASSHPRDEFPELVAAIEAANAQLASALKKGSRHAH